MISKFIIKCIDHNYFKLRRKQKQIYTKQAEIIFDPRTSTGEATYFHFHVNNLLVSTFLVTEFKKRSFTEGTKLDCLTKASPINYQTTLLELRNEFIIQK